MDKSFSWENFERMAKALESLAYIVLVCGPLLGLSLIIFGELLFKMVGLAIIFASILITVYHLSFSLLMVGFQKLREEHNKSLRTAEITG